MTNDHIYVKLPRETVRSVVGGPGSVEGYSGVDQHADLVSACRAALGSQPVVLEGDVEHEEFCDYFHGDAWDMQIQMPVIRTITGPVRIIIEQMETDND